MSTVTKRVGENNEKNYLRAVHCRVTKFGGEC